MQESKKRLRVSPSLIISILALVIATSAGAYAATIAPKNSVVSKSIKNGEVKGKDIAAKAVNSKKIKDGQVQSADIGDGQVTTADIGDGQVGPNDLSAAAKTDLNDATTLGGLTVAQIVAASGGEYYEAKQAGTANIDVLSGSRVTVATLDLPHAGKYLVNARIPVTCSWDGTGADSNNPDDTDVDGIDAPNFPAQGYLTVGGSQVETQYESCSIENDISPTLCFPGPCSDFYEGTTTIEFTRMVTATGPTTVTIAGSVVTSGLLAPGFSNAEESDATASESHIQAITVQ
jgi:hypothetical protein